MAILREPLHSAHHVMQPGLCCALVLIKVEIRPSFIFSTVIGAACVSCCLLRQWYVYGCMSEALVWPRCAIYVECGASSSLALSPLKPVLNSSASIKWSYLWREESILPVNTCMKSSSLTFQAARNITGLWDEPFSPFTQLLLNRALQREVTAVYFAPSLVHSSLTEKIELGFPST